MGFFPDSMILQDIQKAARKKKPVGKGMQLVDFWDATACSPRPFLGLEPFPGPGSRADSQHCTAEAADAWHPSGRAAKPVGFHWARWHGGVFPPVWLVFSWIPWWSKTCWKKGSLNIRLHDLSVLIPKFFHTPWHGLLFSRGVQMR